TSGRVAPVSRLLSARPCIGPKAETSRSPEPPGTNGDGVAFQPTEGSQPGSPQVDRCETQSRPSSCLPTSAPWSSASAAPTAAVVVTQGILGVLTDDELRGVLAHELSHVHSRDILIGSVAAAVAMGITFAARMAMFGAMFGGGGGSRDNEGGNVFGLLAMMIL